MTKQEASINAQGEHEKMMREYSRMYAYTTRIPDEHFVIADRFENKYVPPISQFSAEGKVSNLPKQWGSISQIEFDGDKWYEWFDINQLIAAYQNQQSIEQSHAKIRTFSGQFQELKNK